MTMVVLTVASSPRESENLPDWILSEVLASLNKEMSYQIPTDSFDQILIQDLSGCYRQRRKGPRILGNYL